jgi:hypothetical protein
LLLRAHKVFIGTCIVFCVFFAAVQLRDYSSGGERDALVRAILSAVVAIGLLIYFLRLVRGSEVRRG